MCVLTPPPVTVGTISSTRIPDTVTRLTAKVIDKPPVAESATGVSIELTLYTEPSYLTENILEPVILPIPAEAASRAIAIKVNVCLAAPNIS